jgi:hypothetical protein
MIWNLLAPIVGPVIDKLVDRLPNPNERARAKEEMEREFMEAVNNSTELQAKINLQEAKHRSVFVAGWRPFIGWICGIALAWAFLVQPVVVWAVAVWAPEVTGLPQIETEGLFTLVLAMLGMGTLRTFEKTKGVSREQ